MTKIRVPQPTLPLSAEEKKFYRTIIAYLAKNRAFQDIDTYLVSQLAYRWGRYKYAVEQLQNPNDMIQTFDSGATNVSAWYTVMEREANFVMKLSTQLGISQRSREGILAFKADGNEPGGLMSKLQAIRETAKKKV